MPIYEYVCRGCRKSFSWLVGVGADADDPRCPACGGVDLEKLISRIARPARRQGLDELSDLDHLGDTDDPKAMAEWARKMGRALGEETGEDFDDKIEEMLESPEAGEDSGEESDEAET